MNQKILILGSTGFLGKNLYNEILDSDLKNDEIITLKGKSEVNILDFDKFDNYIKKIKPDIVFNCSSFVGGIAYGYKYPAKILNDNTQMVINIFKSSLENQVKQLINPISNCAYPGNLNVYEESNFWDGKPHESVFNYALTRRLIVALSESYYKEYNLNSCNLVLSNMYGPNDHFDEERSHALGALIKKISDAKKNNDKTVNIWGTGSPIREWLYVKDGAKAMIKSTELKEGNYFLNIGVNKGISIKNLAEKIAEILNWDGNFNYQTEKPDGALEKRVEGSKSYTQLKWKPEVSLDNGLKETIDWYAKQTK
tara:strand:- start:47735 stop:48667 length:933 start_codon:yes stop_codon:yes gene_type:complete